VSHGGYAPLPDYEPPVVRTSSAETGVRFPLVLACAKHALFCETQHRALPSLRGRALEPEVELHPHAAAARGVAADDRVRFETPAGSVIARARFNDSLQPDVVCGQHGWWQACEQIGAPGRDPFSGDGANFNLLIDAGAVHPVSGSVPHRAFVCDVPPVP
jgi:anaerobic selenocysteine-containing dehydrogenase